jgi:hypothetical protein
VVGRLELLTERRKVSRVHKPFDQPTQFPVETRKAARRRGHSQS